MVKRLLLASCVALSLPCMMGQTKNFKAACLNVDGLPPSISIMGINVTLNPDGARETGSARISELIAQKGWDFFGVSEDFNYHNELISNISNYYNIATYRGEVSTGNTKLSGGLLKVNTDGLGLMWKKSMNASNETLIGWNKTNGYTSNGADELLLKGYRYYCVTVANGLAVDVYVHHMDAETDDADIAARESQINQLVAAIKASDNHRPIIIMGDTNCRYTRDRLQELLIDAINEDSRFEIHDPWVDFQWNGEYPAYGTSSLMTSEYGEQKGEVVDKIFYINNSDANGVVLTANSYLHDTDFSYADGSSISDHYPIVIDFTIQNTSDNLSADAGYYVRSVKTGEFLCAGANWGTHAVVGETGNYITLESAGTDGQYYLHSTCGYIATDDNNDIWMDNAQTVYTITKSDAGNYIITTADGRAFTVQDDNRVLAGDYVKDDSAQEWQFISKDDLTKELYAATDANPKDATFFIKGANFSRNDSDNNAWTKTQGNRLNINFGGIAVGDDNGNNYIVEFRSDKFTSLAGRSSAGSLAQTVSGLPNGKYRLSVQAFQRHNGSFSITANGIEFDIPSIEDGAQDVKLYEDDGTASGNKFIPNSIEGAAAYFNAGLYTTTVEFTIDNRELSLLINKSHTTSVAKWYAVDNFKLTYLGPTDEDNAVYVKVKAAMDDAEAKAAAMNLYNYNNAVVAERYDNRQLVGNGDEEVKMTYVALANAAKSQNQLPADMSYAILNNSFEMGDLTYWTADEQAAVEANAEALNADGVYTFAGETLSQSTNTHGVTMQNGLYELTAMLSDGGTLTANGFVSEPAQAADGELAEVSVRFPVSAGTIEISATGMNRADNFTLTRVSDNYAVVNVEFTAAYRTLILPFDSELPEGMTAYTVDSFDSDGDGVKVLQMTEATTLEANTPYLVKYDVRTRSNDLTFVDVPTNLTDTYTIGLLTGTLVDRELGDGEFTFDADKEQFVKLGDGETATVQANNAYIAGSAIADYTIIGLDGTNQSTGVSAVMVTADATVDVYSVSGVLLKRGATYATALDTLPAGVYILRHGDIVIKRTK